MTFATVLSALGSAGGLSVLMLMVASPFLAELLLPSPARAVHVAIPQQRASADPVRVPQQAA